VWCGLNNNYLRKADKFKSIYDLYQQLTEHLCDRLEYTVITPKNILIMESRFDIDYSLIRSRYPQANIYQINTLRGYLGQVAALKLVNKIFSPNAAKQYKLVAKLDNIPLPSEMFDLIIAPFALSFYPNYVDVLKEIRRLLKKNATFFLSGLGVDSFKELREYGLSVAKYPDIHDIGDELIRLNFSNPVLDREEITLSYPNIQIAADEIRIFANGFVNHANIIARDKYNNIINNKQQQKITLEIYSAHAWRDNLGFELDNGTKTINFERK